MCVCVREREREGGGGGGERERERERDFFLPTYARCLSHVRRPSITDNETPFVLSFSYRKHDCPVRADGYS